MAWDDDIKGPGGIRYGVWIPRDPNYVKKQEPKAIEPPKEPANDWIKIKVVDDQSGEVIPKVVLDLKTPDNSNEQHETRLSGLVESLGLQSGNCEVSSDFGDATVDNTFAFVGVGTSPIGKTGASPSNPSNPPATAPGSKHCIAIVEEHKVKTGETLDSLARSIGMSSQDLANFNWKTTNPEGIEKHLASDVGCTQKSADGKKYIFDNSDNPGILYVPKKWTLSGLSTNQIHTIRIRNAMLLSTSTWPITIKGKLFWTRTWDYNDEKKAGISVKEYLPGAKVELHVQKKGAAATSLHAAVNLTDNGEFFFKEIPECSKATL